MNAYADSSFLLSLYSVDAHSHSAAALVQHHQPVFCLTPFSEAEFTNAVELGVFTKRYTAREARAVRDYFLSHIRSGVFRVHDLPPAAYAVARSLSLRHTAKLGTRALDVLHVASALILKADSFFTFDQRQHRLARAEGLRPLPS
jgi:predicted nucleic acid-binding protein